MTIEFKHFVTEEFKKVLDNLTKFKEFSEKEWLSVWRFKTAYTKELEVFQERWKEILKSGQDEIAALAEDVEGKEEKIKAINDETMKKITSLMSCTSDLKKLEYNIIKKLNFSVDDFNIFHQVLKDIPEHEEESKQ